MTDIQTKMFECAESLGAIWQMYPGAEQRFADARFAYDQKKARLWRELLEKAKDDGDKKPTDLTLTAAVTEGVAVEQKEVRDATAALNSVKIHVELIKHSLSAYQSAAKFAETEMRIAGAGGYGS